jgi:hypothetical protein
MRKMSNQECSMSKELMETVEKALTTKNGTSVLNYVIDNPKCAYRDIRLAFPKIGAATIADVLDDFVKLGIVAKSEWKVREVSEEERQKLKVLGDSTKAPYVAYQPFELSPQFAQYKSSIINLIQEKNKK